MSTLVIIGHGMATNRLLETLDQDHPFSSIIVLSDELSAHYNRLMLSLLLAQETALNDITPHDEDWYRARRIECRFGCRVTHLNTQHHTVTYQQTDSPHNNEPHSNAPHNTHNDYTLAYDTLVIATGASTVIPKEAYGFDNQMGFRQLSDVERLSAVAQQHAQVTVIGGGLLGIEAAVGLAQQGAKVTLLHRNPVLMNRQLDHCASDILIKALQQRGINVQCGAQDITLIADQQQPNRISAVSYHNQTLVTHLPSDLVVYAIGIRPNTQLAKQAGLPCGSGILVDQWMATGCNDIYALGECCEFEGNTYGLVAPIWQQVTVLAQQLRHKKQPHTTQHPYVEQDHLTKLKVSGINIHSMGTINAKDSDQILELQAAPHGIYRKVWLQQGRIQGALCVGDVTLSPWLFEQLIEQQDLSAQGYSVLFGPAQPETA